MSEVLDIAKENRFNCSLIQDSYNKNKYWVDYEGKYDFNNIDIVANVYVCCCFARLMYIEKNINWLWREQNTRFKIIIERIVKEYSIYKDWNKELNNEDINCFIDKCRERSELVRSAFEKGIIYERNLSEFDIVTQPFDRLVGNILIREYLHI